MTETALIIKQAAELMQVSYGTMFERRQELGFRLPGSRIWRILAPHASAVMFWSEQDDSGKKKAPALVA